MDIRRGVDLVTFVDPAIDSERFLDERRDLFLAAGLPLQCVEHERVG